MKDSYYYESNTADFFIYASDRKNAKCLKMVHMLHLITHDCAYIDDERILDYFISKVYDVCYAMKKAKSINIGCWYTYGHVTRYKNANNDWYYHTTMFRDGFTRKKLYSFEDVINYMYKILMIIYPYSNIDYNTIYNNPSIKHIISFYYSNN